MPLSLQRADYRVSRAGDFLGLDDPRSFMQSMRSAIDARINTIPEDLLVHVRPTMELTLSQANFRSVMESGWRSEVGRWIDKSLQHGQPLIVEEMQDLPVFGDAEAPAQVSYRFIGHAPCGNGDDGCVELEVRAVIDGPEAIQASQLAMRISGNTRLDVTRYRTETTGRVITDPDTLVPYQSHLEWRHTTELTSEFETISIRESGVLATTYIYD